MRNKVISIFNNTVQLLKGFVPLFGTTSIQIANGEDWQRRQKSTYSTLKGVDLKSYFPHFVGIAKVSNCSTLPCSLSRCHQGIIKVSSRHICICGTP